ncbi:DUF397 domain-containing protein [Streptomyces sp. MBT65]|nr:DUF397 domain-containing protein [Streptomyces sp. MBT65]
MDEAEACALGPVESRDCVYVAGGPADATRLRESDAPGTILTTTTDGLRHLVNTLRSPSADSPHH